MVPHKLAIASLEFSMCVCVQYLMKWLCAMYRHAQVAGSAVCGMMLKTHISAAIKFLSVILPGY